jgi:hypothetical protein
MCAVLSVRSQLGSRKAEPIRHRKSKIRGKHAAADGSVLARVFFDSIQPEVILTEIG